MLAWLCMTFALNEPPDALDQQKGNRRDQNGRAQVKTNNTAYSDSQSAEPLVHRLMCVA